MRWWRHSSFARVVVVALLLWTAADLTNASLCALDNDGVGRSGTTAATATVSDGSTHQAAPQSPQADDCFCCSHCVDVQTFVPAIATQPIALREPAPDFAVPVGFGFPLYHPPLV